MGYIPAKAIPKEAAHTNNSYQLDDAWGGNKVEANFSYLREGDFDLPQKDALQEMGLGDLKNQNEATIAHLLRTKFRQNQRFIHVGKARLYMGATSSHKDDAEIPATTLMKACRAGKASEAELIENSPLCCGYIMAHKALHDMNADLKSQVLCFFGRVGSGKTEQFVASLAYALGDEINSAPKGGEEALPQYKINQSPYTHSFPATPVGKAARGGLYLSCMLSPKPSLGTAVAPALASREPQFITKVTAKDFHRAKKVVFHAPLIDSTYLKIKQPTAGSGPSVATCPYHIVTMYCCFLLLDEDVKDLCVGFKLKETMLKANIEKNITPKEKEDSRKDFIEMQSALMCCGVTATQWSEFMAIMAAIINLTSVGVVGTDSAIISGTSKGYLSSAEALLDLPDGSLLLLLTKKGNYAANTVFRQGETSKGGDFEYLFSKMPQKSSDAKTVLEYLIFEIYSRALENLLHIVNVSQGSQTDSDDDLVLSLVDALGTPEFGSNDDPIPYRSKEKGKEDTNMGMPVRSLGSLIGAYAIEIVRSHLISEVIDKEVIEYHNQGVTLDMGALPLSALRSKRAGSAYLTTLATATSSPTAHVVEGVESHHLDLFDTSLPNSLPNIVADVAFTPRGDDTTTVDKLYTSCKNPALVVRRPMRAKWALRLIILRSSIVLAVLFMMGKAYAREPKLQSYLVRCSPETCYSQVRT